MRDERTNETNSAEEAQAAIRDSIERAKELVCEARLAMRQQESLKAEPPSPKH
ncbi:MAG TPA: hypothetical protein VH331_09980 [Allosphingosinicella sp.]|nr:hypothetical protein [Allosphingosinicella sp.]